MIVAQWSRMIALAMSISLATAGCAFHGLNSLPLPGTVGSGSSATVYHVELANVGTLESNSPVMINDVIVGRVGSMQVTDWHAVVEISVQPQTIVAANAVATVGQTSLLGTQHISLDPPPGQAPSGRLAPGTTVPLSRSAAAPSTEQTLSALSAVVNGGGLGQIGDIIHSLNAALSDHPDRIRDLLNRFDTLVGILDTQRDNINASITELNRIAGTLSGQRDVLADALRSLPPALDVLTKERPRLVAALDKLRSFSRLSTHLVNDIHDDLVKNLQNLQPTLKALADVGPNLDTALGFAVTYPATQDFIDRGIRGDYINFFASIDITIPRLKRGLLLGTRWGEPGAPLVPAPGEPWYLNYSYDPLAVGVQPPPANNDVAPPNAPPPSVAPPDIAVDIAPLDVPAGPAPQGDR
jgi:phospholipid/cholesterol/gamma-HCH transport system substrate-binding protein